MSELAVFPAAAATACTPQRRNMLACTGVDD
jgi:hypothetical protein